MIKFNTYLKEMQLEFSATICEASDTGLAAKASKSGISINTLRTVYRRGVAAWNSGHRPGTTPQQWGMARVNSYITKGKGTYGGADKDLHEALPKVAKDKESGLAKKYVAGLSASTAKARAAHFNKADKLSDRDPRAYEPAPGDATAKTKLSKHTLKYRAMYGESMDEEILEACWSGYKQVGVKKKGDNMVPNCVPEAANPAQQAAIAIAMKKAGKTPKNEEKDLKESGGPVVYRKGDNHIEKYSDNSFAVYLNGKKQAFFKSLASAKASLSTMDEQFDIIEELVMDLAEQNNVDPEKIWEMLDELTDEELLEYAVDAKGHKSSTGGLTQKGRDAYNSKGANLQAPVTTPPSKLKAGSKAANRRKSFCARMSGVEGPMKKPNGEPSRKALALRKWNC
jgi:hypothetical protein